MLEVTLLGPVEARVHGVGVSLSPLERNLLAALALARGRVISTDKIIDCLWGDRVPASPRSRVQGLISSLRRKMGDALVTRQPGYLLDASGYRLDLDRCEDLAHQAKSSPTPRVSAERLRGALTLWRGEPLDGVSAPGLEVDRARLTELRVGLLEERFDAELELGNHAGLVAELAATVSAHPLRERLAGQLMLALYRCNRQADALKAYQALRERLADDLGSDPCADLRNLHATILRGDEINQPSTEPRTDKPKPAQLPAGVGYFTGRDDELEALTRALNTPRHEARVLVVTGAPGLGKTALVVHWAHSVTDRFPDGQIFLDMRGHEAGKELSAGAALGAVLVALDVARGDIPATVEERVALYRTLVNPRRVLIVADNARSIEQLLALMPPTPESLMVVTSRRRLTALAAYHAVHALLIGPLPALTAHELLWRIAGSERLRDPAAARVLDWCGGWPLALRLAGAKLAVRAGQPLASFADDLRDQPDGRILDDDPRSVSSALARVQRELSPAAARLFGRLGLCSDPSICLHLAAAAAETSVRKVRRLLDELTAMNLIVETGIERYRFHDVIRRFARRCGSELLDRDPVDEGAFGARGMQPHTVVVCDCAAQTRQEVGPPSRAGRNGIVAAQ